MRPHRTLAEVIEVYHGAVRLRVGAEGHKHRILFDVPEDAEQFFRKAMADGEGIYVFVEVERQPVAKWELMPDGRRHTMLVMDGRRPVRAYVGGIDAGGAWNDGLWDIDCPGFCASGQETTAKLAEERVAAIYEAITR